MADAPGPPTIIDTMDKERSHWLVVLSTCPSVFKNISRGDYILGWKHESPGLLSERKNRPLVYQMSTDVPLNTRIGPSFPEHSQQQRSHHFPKLLAKAITPDVCGEFLNVRRGFASYQESMSHIKGQVSPHEPWPSSLTYQPSQTGWLLIICWQIHPQRHRHRQTWRNMVLSAADLAESLIKSPPSIEPYPL